MSPTAHWRVFVFGAAAFGLVSLTAHSSQRQTVPPKTGNAKPQPGNPAVTRVRTTHFETFQLVQPVTVGASSQNAAPLTDGDSLTIKAVLNYQACDDRICFAPASVPLPWTVSIARGGK